RSASCAAHGTGSRGAPAPAIRGRRMVRVFEPSVHVRVRASEEGGVHAVGGTVIRVPRARFAADGCLAYGRGWCGPVSHCARTELSKRHMQHGHSDLRPPNKLRPHV